MSCASMLWRADEHEPLTADHWDEPRARETIAGILADAETAERDGFWPGHPLDDLGQNDRVCSLYLGSAGMIWALWTLGSSFDARGAIGAALEHYRTVPDFGSLAHPPSLWMGETGLLLVASLLSASAADPERLRELIHRNRDHPTRELMWGAPGTMLAARRLGFEAEWRDSAELLWTSWERESDLWTQSLYGKVKQYLGPAHGFAGNVHALRGYAGEETLRRRVSRALDRTAIRRDGLVNWPPALDEPSRAVRVQWCHGAPGIVATIGDLLPLELALAAGELIWRAGPLRKGPGLCHGTAGNGLAFLKLYELTGDSRWLERARRFAMHAIDQVAQQRDELGRGRYTLWTGDIGVALYLRACIEARAGACLPLPLEHRSNR